jgi:hypothetical protein
METQIGCKTSVWGGVVDSGAKVCNTLVIGSNPIAAFSIK